MTKVFVSYAREDQKRARSVADFLEKEGHSVWWDRRLAGGSEFTAEIARALEDADVVVVLWSRASALSHWVRDEASKGRDQGKLVPVKLEECELPLGFGQLQAVDLMGPGRNTAGLEDLAAAVRERGDRSPAAAPLPLEKRKERWWRRRAIMAVAALIALAAIGVLGWAYLRTPTEDDQIALAVMPFRDMSPGRDQGALGEGVAEEIMTLVSGTHGLRVIGRTSAWQLNEKSGDLKSIRSKLGATHLLEGSIRTAEDRIRIGVRLLDTRTGEELWSEEYRRPLRDIFVIQEAVGSSVAQRLRGTVAAAREGEKARSIRTSEDVYRLFLAARAVGHRPDYQSQLQSAQLLEQAIALDPEYAPAHANLAMTLGILAEFDPRGPQQNRRLQAERSREHALKAIELAPDYAGGHVGLGMALLDGDTEAALKSLEQAKKLEPSNFQAWNLSGVALISQCRYRDAIPQFRRAIQIEPLLHFPYGNLANALWSTGNIAEAEEVISRFGATESDPILADALQGAHLFRIGQLGESLRYWRQVQLARRDDPEAGLFVGTLLHRLSLDQNASEKLPEQHRQIAEPYWNRDFLAAAQRSSRLGPRIWELPLLPELVAKAYVQSGRSSELIDRIERQAGGVETLLGKLSCPARGLFSPTLVVALREAGREAEAGRVLQRLVADHRMAVENGYSAELVHVHRAELQMLLGRPDDALANLERAVRDGWLDQGKPWSASLDDPVFRPLRDQPRFRSLAQRIEETISGEARSARGSAANPR